MNNYVSIREIIDKLLINKIYQKDFNQADTITWIGGAIRSIKGGVEVKESCCIMEVVDYMSGYPKGFVRLRNIFRNDKMLNRKQYLYNNNVIPTHFHDTDKTHIVNEKYTDSHFTELLHQLQVRDNIINENYNVNKQELLDTVSTNIDYLAGILRTETYQKSNEWFDDNPDCIKFSFEKGYVIYDYKTYVLDEEGLPKIYDNHEYKECLFYYCLYMNELSNGRYNEARELKQLYEQYLGRAINQIKRFTYKEADDFSDNWTNLLFNLNNKPYYQN